jgi:hypothetical protein
MGDPRQIQRHPWEISGMRNSGDTGRSKMGGSRIDKVEWRCRMEDPMETLRELWEICGREMRKRGEKIQENLTRRDIYYERLREGIQKTYRKIRNERFRGGELQGYL